MGDERSSYLKNVRNQQIHTHPIKHQSLPQIIVIKQIHRASCVLTKDNTKRYKKRFVIAPFSQKLAIEYIHGMLLLLDVSVVDSEFDEAADELSFRYHVSRFFAVFLHDLCRGKVSVFKQFLLL